jgi:TonB family protein
MFSDRTFQVALIISVIAHGVLFIQNSNLSIFTDYKKQQQLVISYIKQLQETKVSPKTARPQKDEFLKLPSKITANKIAPPPFVDKEKISPTFIKPELAKSDVLAVQKKITLPPLDLDKINNPSYISYYQIVREKIRRAAYRNYVRNEIGEVYLSFIISRDGYLREVRLSEDRSSGTAYLKDVALRSIKEASPFPDFPKELDYYQLSFNVIISFEIQ